MDCFYLFTTESELLLRRKAAMKLFPYAQRRGAQGKVLSQTKFQFGPAPAADSYNKPLVECISIL